MKQQKSDLPSMLSASLAKLRVPFISRAPVSSDPIDALVNSLADSLDVQDGRNEQRTPSVREIVSATAAAAPKKSIFNALSSSLAGFSQKLKPGKQKPTAEVIFTAAPTRNEIDAEDSMPQDDDHPVASSIAGKPSFLHMIIGLLRRSSSTASKNSDVGEEPTSATKKKSPLPMRLLFIGGGGVAAAALIGFLIFGTVLHKPHAAESVIAKSTAIPKVVAAGSPKKSGSEMEPKKQVSQEHTETTKVEENDKSAEKQATSVETVAESKAEPADEKIKKRDHKHPTEHLHTITIQDGLAMHPSEVVVPAKSDSEGYSAEDAILDSKIIAEIRPQIHHLCGLQVTKVLGWNYRDGYLFCYIRGRSSEKSNLLQRSPEGEFTFIGGSSGLMSSDEMSDVFLVDSSTAKSLLAHMIAPPPMHAALNIQLADAETS